MKNGVFDIFEPIDTFFCGGGGEEGGGGVRGENPPQNGLLQRFKRFLLWVLMKLVAERCDVRALRTELYRFQEQQAIQRVIEASNAPRKRY